MTLSEAEAAVDALFDGAFGEAGAEVVVEEFLRGEEISFFALSDGVRATPFGSAQDHKRVGDGDTGPNTGGMGACSPPSLMTSALSDRVMREIVSPTVAGMAARGAPFRGVLFAGLMIGDDGPKLIEFNVRFGDPEAEVILARLHDDLLEYLWGAATGALPERAPQFTEDAALAVVMATRGYPGPVQRGSRIGGLREAADLPGVSILHAATRRDGDAILADGGRVLAVAAIGRDLAQARERAYAASIVSIGRALLSARHRRPSAEGFELHMKFLDESPSLLRRTTSPTVAIALGSGGARGLAHVVVLEALDELGIRPVAIAAPLSAPS